MLWTVAHKVPLYMGFSRQEYWSRLPYPPPGDLPDLWIKPSSLTSPALAWVFFSTSATCCCCLVTQLCPTLWPHGLQHASPSSSVQLLSNVWFFATPWTPTRQASLYITNSQGLLKLKSIELVMPSSHLILCHPLLLLPSIFPSIRVFSKWVSSSHQVAKGLEFQLQHQSFQWIFGTDFNDTTQSSHPLSSPSLPAFNLSQHQGLFQWVSASHRVTKYWSFSFRISLSLKVQGWFPLGLTGLISLMSKGLSRVLSSTIIWKYQCFRIQHSSWPNSHIRTWLLEKP